MVSVIEFGDGVIVCILEFGEEDCRVKSVLILIFLGKMRILLVNGVFWLVFIENDFWFDCERVVVVLIWLCFRKLEILISI